MRTQIYGVQLIHRENNALGSLQLPHCFLFFHSTYIHRTHLIYFHGILVSVYLQLFMYLNRGGWLVKKRKVNILK